MASPDKPDKPDKREGRGEGEPAPAEAPAPEGGLAATKKEFIQTFFKRAEEFTETLLRENERLRFQVLDLDEKLRRATNAGEEVKAPGSMGASLRELVGRIEVLEKERDQMLARFRTVELQNQSFEDRYREIERENNNLANLYVASYQLHSTLDLREVTQIILEIILNFVGAKTFAILLLDEQRGVLRPLAAEGIGRERVPSVRAGEGVIGRVMGSGTTHVEVAPGEARTPVDLERPIIVSPLRIKEKVVGAIVIWELLRQKTELAEVDYEIFNLLAAHAASALQGAKLNAELGGRAPALWGAVDLV